MFGGPSATTFAACPQAASMLLLSATGTLRVILVLLIVWLLLRAYVRSKGPAPGKPPGTHWGTPDNRAKGEVRIEKTEAARKPSPGPIEDADFEEIK
jgi:hypothetical protein